MANDRVGDIPVGAPYLIHAFEHRAYPLTQERPLIIGRDIESDIIVNEVSVSRRHVEVRGEGGEYILHAVGSTPTLLNDAPVIAPQTLREGDTILVGTMRFVFTHERLPVAMTVAPAQPPRLMSIVELRRPTLTFARQDQMSTTTPKQWSVVWVAILIVVAIVTYFAARSL